MKAIHELRNTVEKITNHLSTFEPHLLSKKPLPGKWSKKEILGHLIDSGINNLQRFTEIQFMAKPFTFQNYRQDDLVIANDYQHADINELLTFYKSINQRVIKVMELQTDETLQYEIINPHDNRKTDLMFLMNDYVDHMNHHYQQILKIT